MWGYSWSCSFNRRRGKKVVRGKKVDTINWNEFLQTGLGILQLTPETFWNMTMIEFNSACEGFSKFHSSSSDTPMTKDEMEDLMERYPD